MDHRQVGVAAFFAVILAAVARFWSMVDTNGPVHPVLGTRCHLFTGARADDGRGQFSLAGRPYRVHQVAWWIGVGDVPEGHGVLHHCDTPLCTNYAEHLFTGTHLENMRDMREKGRAAVHGKPRGSDHGRAKITEATVIEIRAALARGLSQPEVAAMFNVGRGTVGHIKSGTTWRHVSTEVES